MSFSIRLLLGYFAVLGISAYFFLNLFVKEIQPGVRQAMEETMVDTANLLAEIAAPEVASGRIQNGFFALALQQFRQRETRASIWNFLKRDMEMRVYITNSHGIVIFDSSGRQEVGKDYSQWNDVYLTLQGRYGARSTRVVADDPLSSVSYVAAPIMHEGRMIGVLTVAKPNISVQPYIERGEQKVKIMGALLLAASLVLGIVFSWGLMRSVRRLSEYARAVSQKKRVTLPKLTSTELSELGHAMEQMRHELEGKAYVEHYVQTLTHEMKSPLAGIQSAAELLSEDMDREARQRFLANIRMESQRLHELIERMLALAALEQQQALTQPGPTDMIALARDVLARRHALLSSRAIRVDDRLSGQLEVRGDAFLLQQAISNLLDNAIAFTPAGGTITFSNAAGKLVLEDSGPGIPAYAIDKIFERFYSLPRPDTGKKSSGLGLNFVREIMSLHGGTVTLENLPGRGVRATLHFRLC